MATPCRVKLYAAGEEEAERGRKAAYAEIAAVDAAMNDWNPESEISRLSARAGQGEVAVSEPLFTVLLASRHAAALSGGAFDVTVGPVVGLWRRSRKGGMLPDPAELRAALDLVGFARLHLDSGRRSARLERAGMKLDLGGIAKGYACDRALAALASMGITRALVDTGGGYALGDPPPDAPGWRIKLADTSRIIVLSRCGVATSGDWERFVEINGVRYSHIVDPKTGLGLTNRALVTVVAPDGMAADALSTAVSVLGSSDGIALAERLPGTEAWIRWREGDRFRTARSSGFEALLAQD